MAGIELKGTGGIIEGNLGAAAVNVNLDAVLELDGDGDRIDFGDLTVLDGDGSWSQSVWVKFAAGGASSQKFAWKHDAFGLGYFSGAIRGYMYYSGGDTNTSYSLSPIGDGSWYHIAQTYDGSNLKLYVNGDLKDTESLSSKTIPNVTNGLSVSYSDAQFKGNAADMRLYSSALDATEIGILASKIGVDNTVVQSTDTRVGHWMLTVRDSTSTCAETVTSGDETDDNIDTSEYRNFTNGDYVLIDDEIIGPLSAVGDSGNLVGIPAGSSGRAMFGTATAEHTSGDKIFIVNMDDLSTNSNLPTLVGDLTTPSGDLVFDAFSVDVYDGYDGSDATTRTTTDGTFTVTQGKVEGKALTMGHFDGTNDFVSTSNAADLSFGDGSNDSPFSLSAWIKADANSFPILSKGRYNNSDGEYAFTVNSSGHLAFELYDESVASCYVGQKFATAVTLNQWIHVTGTYNGVGGSGASAGVKLYIDGVLVSSAAYEGNAASYVAMEDLSANMHIGRYGDSSTYADGEIRDVKLFDYELSAEQVASMYSNTYPQTPYHHYKLDEGSGTVATDLGTATQRSGFMSGATYTNGTLDLDNTVRIETNGTLSAPRGTMQITGASSGINWMVRNGTFTHNNGTVDFIAPTSNATCILQSTMTGNNAFYDLHATTTTWLRFDSDIDIHHEAASGYVFWMYGGVVTMGTDDYASGTDNSDNCIGFNYIYGRDGNTFLYGANQLKPYRLNLASGTHLWINSGHNSYMGDATHVRWGNMSGTLTMAGVADAKLKLMGDMEFDAVTVGDGDTLDFNGQRALITGVYTQSSGSLMDNASSLVICQDNVDLFGNIPTSNSSAVFWHDTPSLKTWRSNYSEGTFFVTGSETSITGYAWSKDYTDKLIVGSGTFDTEDLAIGASTNIQIATGGILDAGSSIVTNAGDFTTSGGLLGASCLEFNGSDEYAKSGTFADDRNTVNNGDYTIEFWFKKTTTAISSGQEFLFDYSTGSNNLNRSFGRLNTSEQLQWLSYTSGGGEHPNLSGNTTGLNDGKWHHAAYVFYGNGGAHTGIYPNGAKAIYLDGKLDGLVEGGHGGATHCGYDQGTTMALTLGRDENDDNDYFDGCMDEIRIWSDVRTQTEIRANMFSEVASTENNLRHQYSCNEGTGGNIEDIATDAAIEAHLDVILTPYNAGGSTNGLWAESGTFTHGTSTLRMTGTSKKINFHDNEEIYNLDIEGTTTLDGIAGTDDLKINGVVNVTGTLTSLNDESLFMQSTGTNLMIPQALSFDGTNDHVIATSAKGDIEWSGQAFTMSAWVYMTDAGKGAVMSLVPSTSSNDGVVLVIDENSTDSHTSLALSFKEYGTSDNDNTVGVTAADTLKRYKWHHIGITYNGGGSGTVGNYNFYIDGALFTTGKALTAGDFSGRTDTLTANKVYIGRDKTEYFKGNLADVRLYDDVLTAAEVTVLAKQILPNSAHTDNLIGWWKLDETAGTSAADSSINSNAGTHTNAPTKTGNKANALATLDSLRIRNSSGTVNLPSFTTEWLRMETNAASKAYGDITTTGETYIAGMHTYSVNGNTHTAYSVDMNDTATLDMQAAKSTLDFSHTSGFDNDCRGTLKTGIINTNAAAIAKHGVGALEFTDKNDKVVVARTAAQNNLTEFTLSQWVKFASVERQSFGKKGSPISIEMTASGVIEAFRRYTTTNDRVTTDSALSADTWYHIVWTVTGSTAYGGDGVAPKIFINGVEAGYGTRTAGVGDTGDGTAKDDDGNDFEWGTNLVDALMSDIRVYNKALDTNEIKTIYNSGAGYGDTETLPTAPNNLLIWLIGKDATGSTLTDVSGYGNNGTITGATWTNPVIYSSNSSNYNFDLSAGEGNLAVTAYNTLISKGAGTPALRLCQNDTHVLQDVRFDGWTWKPFHDTSTILDVTMRRCTLRGSAAMNLGADGAVSKFHKLYDCEFIHDGGTPITVGQAYLLMKNNKFTNGTSSFNATNHKFNATNISLGHADAFVASRNHDGVANRMLIHGSNVSSPTTATYSFSKYSWLHSDWQFEDTDNVGFEDFTQNGAFSFDTDNKASASLTQSANNTIKVEDGVIHYTGAFSGGNVGGAGVIDDSGASPFEFGVKLDKFQSLSVDIDGEIAGSSINLT